METFFNAKIFKIILSAPKGEKFTRIEILRNEKKYQASMYTRKQVFHSNHDFAGIKDFIGEHFGTDFSNYNAWDGEYEYSARVTKKGKILSSRKKSDARQKNFVAETFNRQKNHIIREGDELPILVDIGVFTKDFKVAAPMRDKFHQINRFLELLSDETNTLTKTINIIDFGCGKSYLTFLVYHFFAKIRGIPVKICGMDLDGEIVRKCAAAAKKYGYAIEFLQGDIGTLTAPPLENWGAPDTFNIVISLHACDTATDHALFNAIKWRADLIFAAPCCQHELRAQMNPRSLKIFSKYGIIKERIASLATDAIRANLLEICGYKAQIIEFAAPEHTAKNLLIRARRSESNRRDEDALREVREILREFSFEPTLVGLLGIIK